MQLISKIYKQLTHLQTKKWAEDLGNISPKKMCVCVCMCVCAQLFATPLMPIAYQSPLSMEFSRLEYWSRLPFPSPGDLPNPGIKSMFLASPALAGEFLITVLRYRWPKTTEKMFNVTNYQRNANQTYNEVSLTPKGTRKRKTKKPRSQ